jgi:biopolymer transport protein ExbB
MPRTVRDRPKTSHYNQFRHSRSRRTWQLFLVVSITVIGMWLLSLPSAVAQAPPPAQPFAAPPPAEPVAAPLVNERPIPTKNLLQVLRDGGPMMIPIGICSFLLLVFVFERAVSLRRGRVIPGPFVNRFLTQLREREIDRDTAWDLCEENRSPISQVFAAGVKKWGRPSVEIEQALIDAGERVATGLRKYLRLFNCICTISPMLGLIGTVFGMISSFNSIANSDAMGRPDKLASGISEALLTTAAGLCVAIPSMVTYLYFVSRVDQLIIDIDSLSQELVELIASDAWRKETAEDEDEKPRRRAKAA